MDNIPGQQPYTPTAPGVPQGQPDVLSTQLMAAMQQMDAEDQAKKAAQELELRKVEAHNYLKNWLSKSMMYRRAVHEGNWARWRRNARNIYDPVKLSRKEAWQNRLFVPLSMQTKEITKSKLQQTLIAGLPFRIRPSSSGTEDEALNIKDLTLRQFRKGKFPIKVNHVWDDVCTYGTGFLKSTWKKEMQWRRVRQPIPEPITQEVIVRMKHGIPPQIVGYNDVLQPRKIYDGVSYEWVSIWDMFFAEGASTLRRAPMMQRTKMSYEAMLVGIQEGWIFPDVAQKLLEVWEKTDTPLGDQSKPVAHPDQQLTDLSVPRTVNEKQHTVYEAWMDLPQKWVYLRPEDQKLITDPNKLVPAKALFTAEALVSMDENPYYDGDNCFDVAGYVDVPGSIYALGPMEMIEQIQDSLNEDTNQRKDNEQLAWNKMFTILESAIVSKADLVSRPGGGVRIKKNSTDDVRKAMMWQKTPDVAQSAWTETFHTERYAGELTGINRTMIASGGSNAQDATQTKGGMELMAQIASARIAYYAQLIQDQFVESVQKRTYQLVYSNIDPKDLLKILGPERAALFQLRPPEDIYEDYYFSPEGVFSNMHQPMRIAQWQAYRDQYSQMPFFNDIEFARIMAEAIELPNMDKVVVPMRGPDGQPIPFNMMQWAMVMAGQRGPGGKAGAEGTTPRIPTEKPGRNAPQHKAP